MMLSLFQATYHRVKLGTKERMSIPYFFMGATSSKVDPAILCPKEEPKYPSMTWREYVKARLAGFKEYQDTEEN